MQMDRKRPGAKRFGHRSYTRKCSVFRASTAQVNIKDRAFGWTPVHFAAHLGSSHLVKLLVDGKAHLDTSCSEGLGLSYSQKTCK